MIFAALVALVAIVALLGWTYEAFSRNSALNARAAPGQMVNVGGHRLHIVCSGTQESGRPTVVLEPGVGGWSMHWHQVQSRIAEIAHVCAYDRAGMGWSDPGPAPRDGRQIASELRTLLDTAGVAGPYVLVGASRGGQYARIFAGMYPQDVAGMVLLDAEPEEMRNRSSFAQTAAAQNQMVFAGLGLAARLGLFRLMGSFSSDASGVPDMPCLPAAVTHLPDALHPLYLAVEGQPRCFEAVVAEEAASAAREEQVRSIGHQGDFPVVVVTHGTSVLPPNAGTIEGAAEYELVWQELQAELADRLPNAELVVAEQSGHNIVVDQPDLVVDSVHRVLGL
jgi:pimeloyl-ACP methyl ester carboxylesterase